MSDAMSKLEKIIDSINNIDFILQNKDIKVTQAIEDKLIKPAIRMNLVRIAEHFSSHDLKGINAVRNYIAHDYDSTDDNIIEDVIRYNLPIFKKIIETIKK